MFPYYFAPDRLGIEVMAVGGNPLVGPGCYLGQETPILKSSLSTRPMSSKGYVMGARTGPRFMPSSRMTIDKESKKHQGRLAYLKLHFG
ncbi:primary cilia formation [Pitangus sulphuratus]|nr:primary cilia formation [Pitangus sulphuratus]